MIGFSVMRLALHVLHICLQKKKQNTKANNLRNRKNLENMCVPSEYAFLFLLHEHHNLPHILPSPHCIKNIFLIFHLIILFMVYLMILSEN
jgi:hypothetical protein